MRTNRTGRSQLAPHSYSYNPLTGIATMKAAPLACGGTHVPGRGHGEYPRDLVPIWEFLFPLFNHDRDHARLIKQYVEFGHGLGDSAGCTDILEFFAADALRLFALVMFHDDILQQNAGLKIA